MFLTIGNQQLFLNYAACGLQEERNGTFKGVSRWVSFSLKSSVNGCK